MYGTDIHQADMWGNTALFKAACYNFIDCVDLLLQHGADPNVSNKWGALPIQYAALQGHHQVVSKLLDSGADITARGDESTPQIIAGAIGRGHYECVKVLIDAGMRLNLFSSKNGRILLHSLVLHSYKNLLGTFDGVSWGHVHILKLLFKHGIDVDNVMLEGLYCNLQSDTYIKCECAFLETVFTSMAPDESHQPTLKRFFRKFARASHNAIPFMNMLITVGYDANLDDVQAIQQDPKGTLALGDVHDIRQKVTTPRSLKGLSRLKLRKCLGTSRLNKSDELPLPSLLKDYVRFVPDTIHSHAFSQLL
jgi:ankyrin repeat protein